MQKFTKSSFVIKLIASVCLFYTGVLCVLAGLSFSLFGAIFVVIIAVGIFASVLCFLAIWQIWRKPKFSILVWLMLIFASIWTVFPTMKVVYQTVFIKDVLHPVSVGTGSLELVYEGHDRKSAPVLSLRYTMQAGFDDIYLDGDRYRQVGNGISEVYFRERVQSERPRYMAVERVKNPNTSGSVTWPKRGDISIVIVDRTNQKEIGHWNGPGPGWPGQQAGDFLKAVLHPDRTAGLGESSYMEGSAEAVQLIPNATLHADYQNNVVTGCPDNFVVMPQESERFRELRTPDLNFGMVRNFDSVVCSSQGIFVFSDDVQVMHVYWLSYSGGFLGESHSRIREVPPVDRTVASRIVSVSVKDKMISARKAYFHFTRPIAASVPAEKEIDIIMPINIHGQSS